MSRLANLKPSILREPLRHLFYGGEGIGKSTLAAGSPSPIFFDCEGGTSRVETVRFPFRDEPGGHIPHSLPEIFAAIDELATTEHPFRTLVIDTVDALEALVWAACCEKYSGKKGGINKSGKKLETIEDLPYGKGYTVAVDEWRTLCHSLDVLRARRDMAIVLLGHSMIRTYKNPLDEDYDRFQLRVHDKAAGFLKEWCDVVGFCAFEEGAKKRSEDDIRAKGWHTGKRFIHVERGDAWDAKHRIPLPREIEMSKDDPWGPFAAAVEQGRLLDPEKLCALIDAQLARIGDDELTSQVKSAVENKKDNAAALSRYLNELETRPAKQQAA